jgi:hypothetical protein
VFARPEEGWRGDRCGERSERTSAHGNLRWPTPKQAALYTRGTPKELAGDAMSLLLRAKMEREFPTFTLQIARWEKSMSFSE